MKLIGVLGGTSWPSTVIYYRVLNELAQAYLGGHHSARLLVHSIDYHEIRRRYPEAGVPAEMFDEIAPLLERELLALAACRPDCIVLGNNTLHKSLDTFSERLARAFPVPIPIFHIVDETAAVALADGRRRVLLLATRFTMEDGFFARRLARHGIEAVVPDAAGRAEVQAIQTPLARGESRPEFRDRLHRLIADHADLDAVVLGCTELPLAVDPATCALPVLDTVRIQCERAFRFALADDAQSAVHARSAAPSMLAGAPSVVTTA
ncbi:MAG: amino acid racemase [Proteobacteria bacterium]|nr:amino acid racemase [Burkholderiales bacterium]